MLKHTKANIYLGAIIFLWGLCASAFAGMRNEKEFYALRLLLGIFEAGAFPGVMPTVVGARIAQHRYPLTPGCHRSVEPGAHSSPHSLLQGCGSSSQSSTRPTA